MSVIFVDHLDGTNGADVLPGTNDTYGQRGISGTSTIQYDTSTSALGTSSAKMVQAASFNSADLLTTALGTAISTLYMRKCYRLAAVPNGNLYVTQTETTSGTITARVAVNSAGKIALYDGTTLVATGTAVLSPNTWYRLEWDLVGTSSVLRLYGSPTTSTVLDTITATVAGTAFNRTKDGIVAAAGSNLVTLWMDEVVHDTAATPGPVSGVPGAATGSAAFAGVSTSSQSVAATGSAVFAGSSQPLTLGGSIAGFNDSFTGTTIDRSKWNPLGTVSQLNAAILGCTTPASTLSSAQVWDGTSSNVYISFSAPASGAGELTFTLSKSTDPTKYAQFQIAAGSITMTVLDGGADAGVVHRAVTLRDNVVRFSESGGSVLVEVRQRGTTSWSTLRTFTTPAWWNTLRVVLGGFSSSASTAKAVFSHLNVSLATPSGHLPSSTLSDDFTGTALDGSKWLVSGPGASSVSNHVELDAVSSGETQVTSLGVYALDTASVQIIPAHGSSGDVTTFKLLSATPNTEARFTLTAGTLSAEYRVGDVPDAYTVTVPHDNSQPLYLAFSVDLLNSNLVWSYSFDGISYAVLRTLPTPGWVTGAQFAYSTKAA